MYCVCLEGEGDGERIQVTNFDFETKKLLSIIQDGGWNR